MKLFRNIIAGVIMLTTASFVAAQTTYVILSVDSSKVLTINASSRAASIPVQQWDYTATTSQQWTVQAVGNGSYYIRNVATGKALDIANASRGTAAYVRTFSNGSTHQQWRIESIANGSKQIVNVNSKLELEPYAGTMQNGAKIYQWYNESPAAIGWLLIPVSKAVPTCSSVTSDGSVATLDTYYFVYANAAQNTVHIRVKTWNDVDGVGNAVWSDGWYEANSQRWSCYIDTSTGVEGVYTTEVWGMGTDGTLHLLGDSSVLMVAPPPYIGPPSK